MKPLLHRKPQGMIGALLLLSAIIVFSLLVYLEVTSSTSRAFPLRALAKEVAETASVNLVMYECVAVLIMVGLPLFVQESQSPFWVEVLPTVWHRVNPGLIGVLGLPVCIAARFRRRTFVHEPEGMIPDPED